MPRSAKGVMHAQDHHALECQDRACGRSWGLMLTYAPITTAEHEARHNE